MRPITVTVVGAGNSPAVPLDRYLNPFNISLFIKLISGAINASVEYTGDDVFDLTVTPVWFPHDTLQNKVASTDGTIISPVTAVRLVNAAAGTAQLVILQSGLVG